MHEAGLFDLSEHLERLPKTGDPLVGDILRVLEKLDFAGVIFVSERLYEPGFISLAFMIILTRARAVKP